MPDTAIQEALRNFAVSGHHVVAMSGDDHNFQSIRFPLGEGEKAHHQIVLGNGGTLRSPIDLAIAAESDVDRRPVPSVDEANCLKQSTGKGNKCDRANFAWKGAERAVAYEFGYMHLVRVSEAGWRGIVHDLEDRPVAVCGFPTTPSPDDARLAIKTALANAGVPGAAMERVGFSGAGCSALPS